ncbi:hypothetical protein [Thermomonospora umbrina]|uniref:Uncharacterized protein n=1 Tax=Thermomonospora umbrina TaxID=111806 RepID=A0A3D9SM31_9ACTN|nr:hypothetical protein [Thermomonospora umbrina]REE96787.1 hypothetical protein DFJ69_2236 [Thermomonospora umbrina]
MAKKRSPIARYWGYPALVLLTAAWLTGLFGPAGLLALSGACFFYFAFNVPVWCGADTRKGEACRQNSYGILLGCSRRQHKWQLLKGVFVTRSWRRFSQSILTSPENKIASLSAIAAIGSTCAAGIQLLLTL